MHDQSNPKPHHLFYLVSKQYSLVQSGEKKVPFTSTHFLKASSYKYGVISIGNSHLSYSPTSYSSASYITGMGFAPETLICFLCVILLLHPAPSTSQDTFTRSRATYYGSPDCYGTPSTLIYACLRSNVIQQTAIQLKRRDCDNRLLLLLLLLYEC